MNTFTQAYRTTCIPQMGDRLDTLIPSEYAGRKLEVIVIPFEEEHKYSAEPFATEEEATRFATNLSMRMLQDER